MGFKLEHISFASKKCEFSLFFSFFSFFFGQSGCKISCDSDLTTPVLCRQEKKKNFYAPERCLSDAPRPLSYAGNRAGRKFVPFVHLGRGGLGKGKSDGAQYRHLLTARRRIVIQRRRLVGYDSA